ncbi:MAG: Mov34/MPN/PAD-1 family protein [Promethearchaeota archaeon]
MTRSSSSTSSKSKSQLFVNPQVDITIKHHASTSSKEIYGWLLGNEFSNGDSYVWAAIPCVKYTLQTEISALPDPIEFQDVSAVLPEGIGILGIYHSHPNRIFHSSTDNATLARFSTLYPKMISAVTNPFPVSENAENSTRWFSLNENKESVHEILVTFKSFADERLKFAKWFTSWDITVSSTEPILSPNQLVPHLMPLCLDFFNGAEVSFIDHRGRSGPDFKQNSVIHPLDSEGKQKFGSIKSKKWKKAFSKNKIAYIVLPPFSKSLIQNVNSGSNSKGIWKYTMNLTLRGSLFLDRDYFLTAEEIGCRIKSTFQSQLPESLSRSVFAPLKKETTQNFTMLSEIGIDLAFFGIPLNFGLYSQPPNEIFAKNSDQNSTSQVSSSPSIPKEWNSVIKRSEEEYKQLYGNQTARLVNFRKRIRLLGPDFFESLLQPLDSALSQILANRVII